MHAASVRSCAIAALLSLAGTLLALVPLPAAYADGEPPPAPELRIGTFNIRAGVSLGDFTQAAEAFKPYVDVAGLQEIGANIKNKRLLADHGWGYYRPPSLQQNPVIWRRDLFDFVSARGFRIAKARDLGNEHGGAEAKGDSWATVVRLSHRASGQRISVINVHLVRGAVKAGRPWPKRPKLYKLYKAQVAGTVRAVAAERRTYGPDQRVYLLGDFNVGWEADRKRHLRPLPFRKYRSIGMRSMWQGSPDRALPYGTHNDALIDQVWSDAAPTSTRILNGIKESDHYPAVATYAMPAPADGYSPTMGTVGFQDLSASVEEKWVKGQGAPLLVFDLIGDLTHGYAEVRVVGGSAIEGVDYEINDDELHDNDFSQNRVIVKVGLKDGAEPDETIELRVVDPVNTVITGGAGDAVGTILANEK